MREMTQIRDAVIRSLQEGGLQAVASFPAERMKDYHKPVATVDVGAVESGVLGFCNYLGEAYDPERGTVQELYGKVLDAEILVDIRGRQAALCQSGCETAADVLLGRLPGGIRCGELAWEGLKWEKETELFLRRGKLGCQAVFVARSGEDGGTFLNFQLKGVMTT